MLHFVNWPTHGRVLSVKCMVLGVVLVVLYLSAVKWPFGHSSLDVLTSLCSYTVNGIYTCNIHSWLSSVSPLPLHPVGDMMLGVF